ncbi:MAG: DUF983 domain-containing protein [Chryseobacterium sp.]|nr:MAG: DUF983 domain-containing protein [Chryseobacterium sp.]
MTKLSAIINHKCPRCRKGDMYTNSMFSWHYHRMREHCPTCGLKFEIEPGFFYAAMYVSYVLIVAELVTCGILAFILFANTQEWKIIAFTLAPVILLFTFNFRYSRTLLLYFLSPIKYNRNFSER